MRLPFVPLSTLALLGSALPQTAHRAQPSVQIKSRAPSELPITRVALYKNGVGFFEHAGRVAGDQAVTIDFTSDQLNDVLQSLTAIDLNGGRISGAGYNSTTPLEQQLKTLPLALSTDPSDTDFYNAIRGARVEVRTPTGSISGRLLSIDLRTEPPVRSESPQESRPSPASAPNRRFITVVSDAGIVRSLELTPAVAVTLLDQALHTDVTRYLELLASTRNQGLRHLTLLDRGTGARDLRVSYISEVPVWKSTYRILFSGSISALTFNGALPPIKSKVDASTATLQGWSVVDNTTGSDWLNVHLDLIAGAPQSFIQPLATPYYNRRARIPLPAEAQLTPQLHESGDLIPRNIEMIKENGAPPPAPSYGFANQAVSVQAGPIGGQQIAGVAGMSGMGGGAPGGVLGGVLGGMGSAPAPVNYAKAATQSLAPQTTTSGFDDFFEYTLTDPITIRKNESALVPILQIKLPVERVTFWSAPANATLQPNALRALWITNSSNLTLDRGSFAVVEDGNFGGQGLLDPIHPGERRLLSYAADQAIRVTPSNRSEIRHAEHITIRKGVLTETYTDVAEVIYDVRNSAPESRTVILEHPVRAGYTLDSSHQPAGIDPQPVETTSAAYRFKVVAAPAETAHLHVAERHTDYEYISLVDRTEEQLVLLLRGAKVSPAALTVLQPVFDAHNAILALDDQIRTKGADIAAIAKDQDRLRENLKALKGSAEERTLVKRYTVELNSQEDRLAILRKDLDQLRAQRILADQKFQSKLDQVDFDESV